MNVSSAHSPDGHDASTGTLIARRFASKPCGCCAQHLLLASCCTAPASTTRQHALWNLVVDLRDREIHELTLEARERRQDDRDKRNLAAIVKAGVTGETFRYTFARPLDEPLLWLPDTLAGMAGTRWSTSPSRTSGLHTDLFEEIALPPLPGQA